MKKVNSIPDDEDDMLPEYDFTKAERGKFYRPLDKGYTVHVTKKDGTIEVNHYMLAEGTVLLAPDVLEYFSDSESVNEALRSLIQATTGGSVQSCFGARRSFRLITWYAASRMFLVER